MTTTEATRDVRMTEEQLLLCIEGLRRRRRELARRMERTSYAGKPGMLDSVKTEHAEIVELLAALNHNVRMLQRQRSY